MTPSSHMVSIRASRGTLWFAVSGIALAIGIDIGLLAEIQDRFGFTDPEIGLVAGASFIAALGSTFFLAPLADRGLERQLLLAAITSVVLALLWMTVATEAWQWVGARMGVGLAQGLVTGSARRLAVSWDPTRVGRALADLLTAGIVGFLVGASLGSLLADTQFDLAFLVPGLLMLPLLPFVYRLRPGPMATVPATPSIRPLLRHPGIMVGVAIGSSHAVLLGTLDAVWSRFMTDLDADLSLIGVGFLAIVGPAAFFTPYAGRLADRVNPVRLAIGALLAEMVVVAAMGFASTIWVLLAIGAAQAVVYSFLVPVSWAAVAKVSPADRVAQAQALIELSGLLLAFIAAVVAPALYRSVGPRWLFTSLGLWFGFVAALALAFRSRWQPYFEQQSGGSTPSSAVASLPC